MDLVENMVVLVDALRRSLHGEAYLPGEEGFDASRASWNLTIDHQPQIIVVAASEADVAAAVRFAHENDMPICVQATGHGQPKSCRSGMLLVVSRLDEVTIDSRQQTARVGGGTMWQAVIEKAVAEGLAPISGSSPHVGVVGYTLGGGFGLLSRKYGLATDSVLSMRVVTPDGEIRTVSPQSHSEIFWALLGGGGAYGVVTEITMRLYPHGELFGGSVMFDASLADTIYPTFLAWTKTLPDEVTSAVTMMTYPPVPFIPEFLHGRSMLVFSAMVIGDAAQATEWLAPIRNLPGAEFDMFGPMSFADSAKVFNDPVDPLPVNGRGVILHDVDAVGASLLIEAIGTPSQSPNLMIQLRQIGGAMSRPGPNPTATGDRRRGKYLLYLLGVPMGPATPEAMRAHAEQVFDAIGPYILSRGPLNWLGEGHVQADEIREVFHEDEYALLQKIKAQHDPTNRFRFAGVGIE